jgi:hypothetical protein
VLAERLGIGLIRIDKNLSVSLVSTPRRTQPEENFKLRVAVQLGYVRCVMCATFFPCHDGKKYWGNLQRHISNRQKMLESIEQGKGLVYWPDDASGQDPTHSVRHSDDRLYNRRFLCNTCASLVLGA